MLVADIDLELLGRLVPATEDRFAAAGLERHRRAQWQDAGLVHDELALLVAIDRVGKMLFGLKQHVRFAALCRSRGGRNAAGAGSHDCYLEALRHAKASPNHANDTRAAPWKAKRPCCRPPDRC